MPAFTDELLVVETDERSQRRQTQAALHRTSRVLDALTLGVRDYIRKTGFKKVMPRPLGRDRLGAHGCHRVPSARVLRTSPASRCPASTRRALDQTTRKISLIDSGAGSRSRRSKSPTRATSRCSTALFGALDLSVSSASQLPDLHRRKPAVTRPRRGAHGALEPDRALSCSQPGNKSELAVGLLHALRRHERRARCPQRHPEESRLRTLTRHQ